VCVCVHVCVCERERELEPQSPKLGGWVGQSSGCYPYRMCSV